jgi:hypothetical protein
VKPLPNWAQSLTRLLDRAIRIPGTDIYIGLDPILGALLPELGDALTAVLSLGLLALAIRERVPKLVLLRMVVNIAIDALVGAIPLIGDVFDFAFKANEKNLALIERHRSDPLRPPGISDYLVATVVILLALAALALPIALGIALVRLLFDRH